MSVRFVLNVNTVTIDESLSLRMSAQDLRDALQAGLRHALAAQGAEWSGIAGGEHSLERSQVDAPGLRNAQGLSHAIITSVLAERGGLSEQVRSNQHAADARCPTGGAG